MQPRLICVAATLFFMVALALQLAAKDEHASHHHYKLIDLGTLGGPNSYIGEEDGPLNNNGMVSGCADTSLLDPNYPNVNGYFPAGPYIKHTFVWQSGLLLDLGALPGGTSSCEQWISDTGLIVGGSTNGLNDPLLGLPQVHGTLWFLGIPFDLGTLGGYQSLAYSVNNFGLVVGGALNRVPDPYAGSIGLATGGATQVHAFAWYGEMHDLGTLGTGTDSIAYTVNDHGQVDGESFTNTTVNESTGLPTMHPFLWENDKLKDLGTIGGTYVDPGFCCALNERGEVVGGMTTEGDAELHPFLWDGHSIRDLKTLGGSFGEAIWLNDGEEVIGFSTTSADLALDGFLWKRGTMTDLGTLGGDVGSLAEGINASGQIVGQSFPSQGNGHAFLWENGGPMVNLQVLVIEGSDVTPTEAILINDRGEITGNGVVANGDQHAMLLIPCDDGHPGIPDCDYSLVEATTATQVRAQSSAVATTNGDRPIGWRERLNDRLIHRRGFSSVRSPNH